MNCEVIAEAESVYHMKLLYSKEEYQTKDSVNWLKLINSIQYIHWKVLSNMSKLILFLKVLDMEVKMGSTNIAILALTWNFDTKYIGF